MVVHAERFAPTLESGIRLALAQWQPGSSRDKIFDQVHLAQGMFHDENTKEATYSELVELDLATVEPSIAGPKRPQDRVALSDAPS